MKILLLRKKRFTRLPAGKQGFTLVETLVSVLILATAIAGPLTIASRGLTTAVVAKDRIAAFFLAQDAVEYVRYVRDSNKLKSANWLTGVGGTSSGIDLSPCLTSVSTNGCRLDSTSNSPATPTACGASVCQALNYDTTTSRYTYAAVSSTVLTTLFTRTVSMVSINAHEVRLTVTVAWSDTAGVTRTTTVSEYLFDWQ